MNLPASKAARDERSDDCLHCVLMSAFEGWQNRHGQRQGNVVKVDAIHAISKLSECVAEVINMTEDRSSRRRAVRFAHDAVDAAIKSARSGELVEVDVPAEH